MQRNFVRFTPVMAGLMVLGSWATGAGQARAARGRAAAPPGGGEVPVTRQAIDERVAGDIATLWKLQNGDGHWDAPGEPKQEGKEKSLVGNRGALTALALLALKVAGEDEQQDRFQKALKWLNEQPWEGTYFRGLRATLYGQLKDSKYKILLYRDADYLLRSINGADGMYSYGPPQGKQAEARGGDFSNTQYGILGMWSASDRGYEVPRKYWELAAKTYLASITDDKGWSDYYEAKYGGESTHAYGAMTAAAVATLYVIQEKLFTLEDRDCRAKVPKELLAAIDEGLEWLGKNFSATEHAKATDWRTGYVYYYFYALERAGVASGRKYFGTHDWYREVASAILNGRVKGGSGNGGITDPAWELLFLCYGRAPVAFNKLQFGSGWNEHPRDFAMLCKFLARNFEKHYNWQIMPLDAQQDEFHDAPILAMSGRNRFTLRPAEVQKIKTYILRGGMLFAEAIDASPSFTVALKDLCRRMFPNLELVKLPADHPIYSAASRLKNGRPEVWGLSDGVRLLVVFSPGDLSCDWQRLNLTGESKPKFDFGANLVQYAADGQLWSKEESYWPHDAGQKPATTITVGRLIHGTVAAQSPAGPPPANAPSAPSAAGSPPAGPTAAEQVEHVWNPSGGTGWQRLDILSRNRGGPGIGTLATDLSGPLDPRQVPVLHLTGVGPIVMTAAAKANLKAYVQAGGLLLADSAGGRKVFTDSFTVLVGELFGQGRLGPVPQLSFMAAAGENGKVWYRHLDGLPKSLRPLELLGVNVRQNDGAENWNVLFLPCDLTYAMVGCPASEPVGLAPVTAEKLVPAILNWRAAAAATTAPAAPSGATPATAPVEPGGATPTTAPAATD